jgi:hypothetical protein
MDEHAMTWTLAELAAATPVDPPPPEPRRPYIIKGGMKIRHSRRKGPHPILVWLKAHPGEHLASTIGDAVRLDKSRVANYQKDHPDEVAHRWTRMEVRDGKKRRVALYSVKGKP